MDPRTRWERRTEIPLTGAALAFLVAYAVPIIWPGVPRWIHGLCTVTEWATWAIFGVDYVVRLSMAHDRPAFVRATWLDLLLILVPMLRPLRALRATMALSVLGRRSGRFNRGTVVVNMAAAVALLAFVAALAVLEAERTAPGATIVDFGDAIWWAAATVTTVGYGDLTPRTTEGRLVALFLMITGIALLGVVTAALASWFTERVGLVEATAERTESDVQQLLTEVRALRTRLEAMEGGSTAPEGRGRLDPRRGLRRSEPRED